MIFSVGDCIIGLESIFEVHFLFSKSEISTASYFFRPTYPIDVTLISSYLRRTLIF